MRLPSKRKGAVPEEGLDAEQESDNARMQAVIENAVALRHPTFAPQSLYIGVSHRTAYLFWPQSGPADLNWISRGYFT
jgi:hypothetical protein